MTSGRSMAVFSMFEGYFFLAVPGTYIARCKGPSTKDIRFLGPFFDLPTHPSLILTLYIDYFSIVISDF